MGARLLGQAGAQAPVLTRSFSQKVSATTRTGLSRPGSSRNSLSWPGGGGNLNYPLVYNEGLASMIKEVEERQAALDMRLPNAPKFYFYEACLIS